ncbi:MAG: hypothetical protein WBC36_02550 [Desulfobacterales bacterium]
MSLALHYREFHRAQRSSRGSKAGAYQSLGVGFQVLKMTLPV